MEPIMIVKNKKNGKIYSFPAHLMDNHPELEEVKKEVKVRVKRKPKKVVKVKEDSDKLLDK